eukprot:TRINITY_DN494_c0_g1_i1.p1 TRINITY_DN494_c0_g1~~TRINITY_DN494_c0_g1_i1.p1  ORF type:complete len:672 (-),score=196.74 TRINITY_DN494_c0_g1_i1:53-2068(-)
MAVQLSAYDEKMKKAYVAHINNTLKADPECPYIPINVDNNDIFDLIQPGILLCKLIVKVDRNAMDLTVLHKKPKNKFEAQENHQKAIEAARNIGCKVVGISSADLYDKKAFAFLGIVWQIIRKDLTSKITYSNPEVQKLKKDGEDSSSLAKISAEDLMLRWANSYLTAAGEPPAKKFSDFKDGNYFLRLEHQLDAGLLPPNALTEEDPLKRLTHAINFAREIGCPVFVTPEALNSGDENLNMALVCQIFAAKQMLLQGTSWSERKKSVANEGSDASITKKTVSLEDALLESEIESESRIRREKEREEADQRARLKEVELEERIRRREREFEEQREEEERQRQRKAEEHRKALEDKEAELEQRARLKEIELEEKLRRREREFEERREEEERQRRQKMEEQDQLSARLRFEEEENRRRQREREMEEEEEVRRRNESARKKKANEDEIVRRQSDAEEARRLAQEELARKKAEEDQRKRNEDESNQKLGEISKKSSLLMEEDYQNKPGWRKVFITVLEGRDLMACNVGDGESDPFVVCKHLDSRGSINVKHKTKIVKKNRICPMWDETMEYRDFLKEDTIEVSVWDEGLTGYDFMGEVLLKRTDIVHGTNKWFTLNDRPNRKGAHPSQDRLWAQETQKKEKILNDVTKGRNHFKELVRGKRQVCGQIKLAFETLY